MLLKAFMQILEFFNYCIIGDTALDTVSVWDNVTSLKSNMPGEAV